MEPVTSLVFLDKKNFAFILFLSYNRINSFILLYPYEKNYTSCHHGCCAAIPPATTHPDITRILYDNRNANMHVCSPAELKNRDIRDFVARDILMATDGQTTVLKTPSGLPDGPNTYYPPGQPSYACGGFAAPGSQPVSCPTINYGTVYAKVCTDS